MEEIIFAPGSVPVADASIFTSLRNGFGRKRDICGKERKIKNGHNNSSGIIGEKSILD